MATAAAAVAAAATVCTPRTGAAAAAGALRLNAVLKVFASRIESSPKLPH
jgi:hypothetical protein